MAIYDLPKPGTKLGPCLKPCEHVDCGATRAQADGNCPICDKPVGYEGSVMYLSKAPDRHDVAHADCVADLEDLANPRIGVKPDRWEGAVKEWDLKATQTTLRTEDALSFEMDDGQGRGFYPVSLSTARLILRALRRVQAASSDAPCV